MITSRLRLLLVGLAAAATILAFSTYRALKAASERMMDDCRQILEWLAWRDERLATYDPPADDGQQPTNLPPGPRVDVR
jgi:hypothetical protein